jgi:hypothetical protein
MKDVWNVDSITRREIKMTWTPIKQNKLCTCGSDRTTHDYSISGLPWCGSVMAFLSNFEEKNVHHNKFEAD